MFEISPRMLQQIGQLARRGTAKHYDLAAQDPERAQAAFLQDLLRRHADTAYGREHGFASISTPAAYAERVPLMTPEDLQGWVRRMMQGERNLLTPEAPLFYGMTSGTSGHQKFVPITPAYRAEFQRTVSISFWHLFRRFPEAFTSRFLYFVGQRKVLTADDGLDAGAISGFNYTQQKPFIRKLYAWPYELFEVQDMAARSYMALHQAILGDISLITGIFPLGILTLLRELEGQLDHLAHDLEKGSLEGARGLTATERAFFQTGLRPRPDLARRLRQAARQPVEEHVATIWPQLRLVYCWTTSAAGLYLPELKRRLGPAIAVRDAIYSATEGWCNVGLGDEEPGGPLALTSAYCEFIEERDYAAGTRQTVPLSQLEDGGRYVIVISSSSGAFRYVIGDVLEVCGRYRNTPRIRFLRKFGATSNLAGELLDESHVNAAVAKAMAETGFEPTWFCLVGETSGDIPRYVLLVEPSPAQADGSDGELQAFGDRVDKHLNTEDVAYWEACHSSMLLPLTVKRVRQGSYAAWKQRRIAEGTGEAQLKNIHLLSNWADLPPEFHR